MYSKIKNAIKDSIHLNEAKSKCVTHQSHPNDKSKQKHDFQDSKPHKPIQKLKS